MNPEDKETDKGVGGGDAEDNVPHMVADAPMITAEQVEALENARKNRFDPRDKDAVAGAGANGGADGVTESDGSADHDDAVAVAGAVAGADRLDVRVPFPCWTYRLRLHEHGPCGEHEPIHSIRCLSSWIIRSIVCRSYEPGRTG